MPPDFPGFLASRTFEIICKNKSFFVHSKILTTQSGPLRSSIMGVWKEATEGKIMLLDWDSETVGRFIEFLYTEDYHVSVPEGSGDNCGADTPFTLHDPSDQEELGPKDKNVLRAHAKVYALAQYKDVEALRKIALEKLEEQLGGVGSILEEGPEVALNVVELLEYVYSNTDTLTNSVEPMRDLVSKFAAENFEKLMGQKEMVLLLGDGGDPVVELTEKVRGRLCDLERDVQERMGRATALEEKMWESAAANTEELKRSEYQHATNIRRILRRNLERVQQLEAANKVNILQLETTNADKVRKLEATNVEIVRELEINNRAKIFHLETTKKSLGGGELPSTRGRIFHFLTNVCICCSFFYRFGFRAGMRDLEGQVDEWMLKGRVFTYLVAGSFAVYLVAAFLLVFAIMGVMVVAVD